MLKDHLKCNRIILGSGSPRRQELLKQLEIPFEIRVKPITEIYSSSLKRHQISDYLAQLKALAFEGELNPGEILITSDTIVWHQNKALGKPSSLFDAKKMLQKLSGSKHEVITSICFTSIEKQLLVNASTKVYFRNLNQQEIEYYVSNYNSLDKAGAYGIQDWIGQIGIDKIKGSYYNVMGFPLNLVYSTLLKF
tara:strand:+ start:367 stop:948 length:582 start_codon:yes stop_codon:yes gene_type:complete